MVIILTVISMAASDLDNLSRRASDLARSADNWNRGYLILVGFVAVFGAAAFIVQLVSDSKNADSRKAYNELVAATDEQRRRDIADVGASAQKEAARIEGEAKKEAARIEGEAKKEAQRIESEADVKIAQAKAEASKAEQRTGELAKETEELRRLNNEMEESLAPRELPLELNSGFPGAHNNFDPLKQFAPLDVLIEVIPDAEATRAASEITDFVREAGWKVVGVKANPNLNAGFFDGVIVWYPKLLIEQQMRGSKEESAARALSSILESYKWDSHTFRAGPPDEEPIPPNTIRITVGFKPAKYGLAGKMRRKMKEAMTPRDRK